MILAAGTRVVLRRFCPADLPAFLAYRNDPEVARYQTWEPMDAEAASRMIAYLAQVDPLLQPGAWTQIALADPSTDELLGDMGLYLSDDQAEAEMGINLAREAQGKGRAQEAWALAKSLIWRESAARVIWGIADVRNAASLKLINRSGGVFDHEETNDGVTERFYRYPRPVEVPDGLDGGPLSG